MTHTTQNEECKHEWKLEKTTHDYPPSVVEYIFTICSKCSKVKDVKTYDK